MILFHIIRIYKLIDCFTNDLTVIMQVTNKQTLTHNFVFIKVRINYLSGSKQMCVKAEIMSSIIIALVTGDIKFVIKKMEKHKDLKPLLFKWVEDKVG